MHTRINILRSNHQHQANIVEWRYLNSIWQKLASLRYHRSVYTTSLHSPPEKRLLLYVDLLDMRVNVLNWVAEKNLLHPRNCTLLDLQELNYDIRKYQRGTDMAPFNGKHQMAPRQSAR